MTTHYAVWSGYQRVVCYCQVGAPHHVLIVARCDSCDGDRPWRDGMCLGCCGERSKSGDLNADSQILTTNETPGCGRGQG